MQGSLIEQVYHQLTGQAELRFDPEGGEPLEFRSFVRLDSPPVEADTDVGNPFSQVDRICNFLSILLGSPTYLVRILRSTDGFASIWHSEVLYMYGVQSEFLFGDGPEVIDEYVAQELIRAWTVAETTWPASLAQARVANALAFFQYAWRADFLEHTCLNLSTALEILFAPHSMGETTHQIAFNVAHFLGESPEEKQEIYQKIKRFYGIRSSITHGGLPDPMKVVDPTVEAFKMCVRILRRIILSADLTRTFEDQQRRKAMMQSYLFR